LPGVVPDDGEAVIRELLEAVGRNVAKTYLGLLGLTVFAYRSSSSGPSSRSWLTFSTTSA
jgi:hypothetical protein